MTTTEVTPQVSESTAPRRSTGQSITLFVGRVRDLNHGRDVTGISYDMFVPLALNGFAAIAARAEADFGGKLKLYIGHAKGRLGLGDLAMVVAAGTPHRDEAFRACRQVVEAVTHTSPIWKQVAAGNGLAIHVAGDFPALELDLWAVKD